MRLPMATAFCCVALLVAPADLRAGEPSPVWKDGWTLNAPGRSTWVSDGTPSPFSPSTFLQGTPSLPLAPGIAKDPYGFADYSIGHSFGRDLGFGNMQATLGVRVSGPLAANGFTPSFDPRRYLGAGPRIGVEGNKTLQSSWIVEWHVGAAMLYGDRTLGAEGGMLNAVVPGFSNTGSVFNLDGLLGLSYWFDAASKLTLGYRADYFKGSPAFNVTGTADTAVSHGPMVRFSIQK
jgi:hypothetical protein